MMPSPAALPRGAGIGLKPEHYAPLLAAQARAENGPNWVPAFVEVHPQNYFGDGGSPHRWLTAIAEIFPLSFHSTTLSLGSATGVNRAALDRIAALAEIYHPASISDHLSWSDCAAEHLPDLLPVPYTYAALDHVVSQISLVQDRFSRKILIENPSRYLAFAADEMDEAEFLTALCKRAGCGLLLDINNVIVSANNLSFDPVAYLSAIDAAVVGEVHLAGHAVETDGDRSLFVDDHGSAISEECWALFDLFITRAGPLPTLIEWDTNIPDYAVLAAQAMRADATLLPERMAYHAAA
jgi:uncharacterized protein